MRFELRASSFETPAAPAPQDRENWLALRGLLLGSGNVGEDAHDVAFLHDQEILTVDLDLGAGPLAEQHAVTSLHVEGNELAAVITSARSRGDDFLASAFPWPCRE